MRYVKLNPVRAGMAAAPQDWPWSSHAGLTAQAPGLPWLDAPAMLGYCVVGVDQKCYVISSFLCIFRNG